MFDELEQMPEPVAWDDPGFDQYLATVTSLWAEAYADGAVDDSQPITAGELPLGPVAIASLSDINTSALSGQDRLSVLIDRMRALSHFQALVYEDMAAIVDICDTEGDPQLAWEAASAEIRAALRLTRRSADHELDIATALQDRLPMVLEALKAGEIDQRRAITLVTSTSHLPVDTAITIVNGIIDVAGRLTTGQLRERLRRLALEANPTEAADRYQQAVDDRRLVLNPTEDGTANLLILDAPPDRSAAAYQHIDKIARGLRGPGEARTIDQLRSDVAIDLLCGTEHGHENATRSGRGSGFVKLTVDLATLAGLESRAGQIDGFGPVIADIAKKVAEVQHRSTWTFEATDPVNGRSVATGVTGRRPTASQQRNVVSNDPTCIFPGCRAPASGCDIDHRQPWAQNGPTEVDNLAPLCRHDHRLKHQYGWHLNRGEDGEHQWTSPLGHKYTTGGRSP